MTTQIRLTLEQVHALAWQVLRGHGVSENQSRAIADTITAAERDDCKSHGRRVGRGCQFGTERKGDP